MHIQLLFSFVVTSWSLLVLFHPFVSKLAKYLLIKKLSKPAKFLVFCSFLNLRVMPVSNIAF